MKIKKFLLHTLTAITIMSVNLGGNAATNNPLLSAGTGVYGTLPLSKITPAQYEEGILEGIRLHNAEIDAIANLAEAPTFQNTIVALDRSGKILNQSVLALSNLEGATGDTLLMKALAKVTPAMSEHSTAIMLNEKLWNRIRTVHDNAKNDQSLTPEQRRLIDKTYQTFLLAGADLKGKDREKLSRLNAELSDLNVRFSQNVANAFKLPEARMWLKKEDLDGIPESIIASYRSAAKDELAEEGKPDDESLYLVTLYRPSYAPFMTYAKRRDLREKLYRINGKKNTYGEFDNAQILKDIANIRLEIANLMGCSNFAEYNLQNTMAKTPQTVMEFLEGLRTSYTEPMRKEIAEITDFARATEGADFVLMPWDYSYWSDKLKNARYAFNEVSIVCNFTKPVGNEDVLLNSDEVETFLHEFGHALHGLSAEATYETVSGTNVEHDFVELFSQFNENYLTQKEYLDSFAKHHKTGKKMPQELLDRFVKASQYAAAYSTMRQLGFGYLDMAYHTITEPLRASADIEKFEKKAMEPVKVFDAVEGCVLSPSFGHIFSGGYAAGYYGYKWAESLDADAFKAFKETGIFNKNTAEKFHKMLQSGDTKDPMELYIEFRGKKPTVDALLERDGIK